MYLLRARWMAALVLLLGAVFFTATPQQSSAQTSERCFSETGQCISGRIREFWEQNGGLTVFGYPIGPQHEEQVEGKALQIQWFERNRLELHPENQRPYDVLLGRLGVDLLAKQGRDWFQFPKSTQQSGCRFFAETGHNVCGQILSAWRASGLEFDGKSGKSEAENLALFGMPLSDAQEEDTSSGRFTVQWFERARFELHPENQPPYNVQLGLLGNEISATTAAPVATPQPTQAPTANACADVPEPVSARVVSNKCLKRGEVLVIDIYGFQPNEEIGYWINAPDGEIVGTVQTVNIGKTGEVDGVPFPISSLPDGIYSFVFQGVSSKHQSIVYFKVMSS